MKSLVVESHFRGGQGGASSRIENYLGFPTGLSGAELTRRAIIQATRLGAEILLPRYVREIRQKDGYKKIVLDNGNEIDTHTPVITPGPDYRNLETHAISDFTGAG